MNKNTNPLARIAREPVTLAIVIAVLITSVLTFAVLAIWSGNPDGDDGGVAFTTTTDGPSPTPRTIHWPTEEATRNGSPGARSAFTGPATVPEINAVMSPTAAAEPTDAPPPTASPEPTASSEPTASPEPEATATAAPSPTATPAPTREALFEAADAAGFQQMQAGGWFVSGDTLVYDTPQATSQPWLLAPGRAQTGDFAVEAEIRVDSLGEGYCNQNFGVVAGSDQTGLFWGGGIIYPCGSNTPRARITDVSNWTDGYDQDRSLASDPFDPGREWHVYRLEVRGNELTLLIDGDEVLTSTDSQMRASLQAGQAGFWTQGARLTVRRLAVYGL